MYVSVGKNLFFLHKPKRLRGPWAGGGGGGGGEGLGLCEIIIFFPHFEMF